MTCTTGSVRCPICKKIFMTLTYKHLQTHQITKDEFAEKYPQYACFLDGRNTFSTKRRVSNG